MTFHWKPPASSGIDRRPNNELEETGGRYRPHWYSLIVGTAGLTAGTASAAQRDGQSHNELVHTHTSDDWGTAEAACYEDLDEQKESDPDRGYYYCAQGGSYWDSVTNEMLYQWNLWVCESN